MPLLFALVFGAVLSMGLMLARGRGPGRAKRDVREADQRDAPLHGAPAAATLRRSMARGFQGALARVAPLARGGGHADGRLLLAAGSPLTAEQFGAARLLAVVGGVIAGAACGGYLLGMVGTMPGAVLGGFAGYAAPDLWLGAVASRRRRQIDRELLYFLEFLALAAQSGLSMDQAVQTVAPEFPGILSDAFERARGEREMGQWNEHALGGLADRLGHKDVYAVTEALVRAGQFGSRTAAVLRQQAQSIRRQRNEAAREHANRAGAAIILPVAVFIMPVIVILLGYPALTSITGALGPHG